MYVSCMETSRLILYESLDLKMCIFLERRGAHVAVQQCGLLAKKSNQIAYRFVYNRIKLCLMFHHHHHYHHHHQTIHLRVYPILRHALITL